MPEERAQFPTVAGCDCGKNSLVICLIDSDIDDFKKWSRNQKSVTISADREGVEKLLGLNADTYALEPTGAYSRLWINVLEAAGKDVRLVNPSRVKFVMRMHGVNNKNDRLDAAGIAYYCWLNHSKKGAFLKPALRGIRDRTASRTAIVKSGKDIRNQIGSRLSHEWPEGVKAWEQASRRWGQQSPVILRAIAGEDQKNKWTIKLINEIAASIGSGLSEPTIGLARQLYGGQEACQALEAEIEELLASDFLEPYNQALDPFMVGLALRAALIPAIYPLEKFLDDDGKRIVEYTTGTKGQRSKRDRTEAAFKLSAGMGRIQVQSGGMEKWKAGGDRSCRTAIWQYVKTQVAICRIGKGKVNPLPELIRKHNQHGLSPWLNPVLVEAIAQATETTVELATLRVHYECNGKTGKRRDMATASRFIRMLYKSLVRRFNAM